MWTVGLWKIFLKTFFSYRRNYVFKNSSPIIYFRLLLGARTVGIFVRAFNLERNHSLINRHIKNEAGWGYVILPWKLHPPVKIGEGHWRIVWSLIGPSQTPKRTLVFSSSSCGFRFNINTRSVTRPRENHYY